MRVDERMSKTIHSCRSGDSLATAAKAMSEHDCGCVPVVDDRGHVLGMLTDRDICMAALTSGLSLQALLVDKFMTVNVASARPSDSLVGAEMVMRARGVRRLPVLDDQDRIIGMLSCNDLLRWVDDGGTNGVTHHDAVHLVRTLAMVGKPKAAAASPASPQQTPAVDAAQAPPRVPYRSGMFAPIQKGFIRLPGRGK